MDGKLFDSELKVMEVLWEQGPTLAKDIVDILAGKEQLAGAAEHLVDELFCLAFRHLFPGDQGRAQEAGLAALDGAFFHTFLDDGVGGVLVPADAAGQYVYDVLGRRRNKCYISG